MKKNYEHNIIIHNPDSANEIFPLVLNIISPKSVVDIGCGLGDWLWVAMNYGIKDVLGVDGNYIAPENLFIPQENFKIVDLTIPLKLDKKYDLAICLEVGEHLPNSAGPTLVESLTNSSNFILFSAAIPGQGGQNHLNEQPFEYWQGLFENYGYSYFDIIRPQIWGNSKVKWWYQQNIFLVSNQNITFPLELSKELKTYIHPILFNKKIKTINKIKSGKEPPSTYLKLFFKSIAIKIKRLLKP